MYQIIFGVAASIAILSGGGVAFWGLGYFDTKTTVPGETYIIQGTDAPTVTPRIIVTNCLNSNHGCLVDNSKYGEGPGAQEPTPFPSAAPTTLAPTSRKPTNAPTPFPVVDPTPFPTISPTPFPTTGAPTNFPTAEPTDAPSTSPTQSPTTDSPTASPTTSPSKSPTDAPTTPTIAPTGNPSTSPTQAPTGSPTQQPTASPTAAPTDFWFDTFDSAVGLGSYVQQPAIENCVISYCGITQRDGVDPAGPGYKNYDLFESTSSTSHDLSHASLMAYCDGSNCGTTDNGIMGTNSQNPRGAVNICKNACTLNRYADPPCVGITYRSNRCYLFSDNSHIGSADSSYSTYKINIQTGAFRYQIHELSNEQGAASTRPNRPAVILIHGGGFQDRYGQMDNLAVEETAQHLAAAGYLVIETDYQAFCLDNDIVQFLDTGLDGNVGTGGDYACGGVPAARFVAEQTLEIISELADESLHPELVFDRRKIALVGQSAGGFSAIEIAKNYVEDFATDGYLIKAVVSLAAGYYEPVSLTMPHYLVHGASDTTVLPSYSENVQSTACPTDPTTAPYNCIYKPSGVPHVTNDWLGSYEVQTFEWINLFLRTVLS